MVILQNYGTKGQTLVPPFCVFFLPISIIAHLLLRFLATAVSNVGSAKSAQKRVQMQAELAADEARRLKQGNVADPFPTSCAIYISCSLSMTGG